MIQYTSNNAQWRHMHTHASLSEVNHYQVTRRATRTVTDSAARHVIEHIAVNRKTQLGPLECGFVQEKLIFFYCLLFLKGLVQV
jgi:hypothetical protein